MFGLRKTLIRPKIGIAGAGGKRRRRQERDDRKSQLCHR